MSSLESVQIEQPAISFDSITFSDGTEIRLDPTDIVVFVGPNNSGKSAALRELESHIARNNSDRAVVLPRAKIKKKGTGSQFVEVLENVSMKGGQPDPHYSGYGYRIRASNAAHYFDNGIEYVRPYFCNRISTENRIDSGSSAGAFRVLSDPPSHPIHILYKDDRIERRISGYFKSAFGLELIVFKAGGSEIPLLVGPHVPLQGDEDRTSASYAERLMAQCSPLREQGDGMRSFAGVILQILAIQTPTILLLDEPEAFLHPPQARLLGEFLARERPTHSQLFIATHSVDVLVGLLTAASAHLRIIRLQRDGNVNRVTELEKAQAKKLADDPLMKYSSVLSGVFYQRVIICESDADCLFYQAILSQPSVHAGAEPDVLFLHASGKHRMAILAEALRSLGVAVDVIADLDILNEQDAFQRIVTTLGGNWNVVVPIWKPLKQAIEERKPWLNARGVADKISKALEKIGIEDEFPAAVKKDVEEALKMASPWTAIKQAGEAAIPPGQATQQMSQLKEICEPLGLWIVPVGELEGFCKPVGGHGPRWVQQVIEQYHLRNDPILEPARNFMRKIWQHRRS